MVEIVADSVGLTRLSIQVDDEIGPHGRPEHQTTAFEHIRFAGLAVMRDDHGPVPLEPKAEDPGERRVDNPKPYPFPGLHRYAVGNSSIDRDGVADATGHPRFHAVAEAGRDPALIVEPPVLDKPQQIAIDGDGRAPLSPRATPSGHASGAVEYAASTAPDSWSTTRS